jgi:hypothetical protein
MCRLVALFLLTRLASFGCMVLLSCKVQALAAPAAVVATGFQRMLGFALMSTNPSTLCCSSSHFYQTFFFCCKSAAVLDLLSVAFMDLATISDQEKYMIRSYEF